SASLMRFNDSIIKSMADIANLNKNQLKDLQDSNSKKLEQIRETVDEKLNSTLEKRLGESFKLVSERLESVYRGLGEMQNLASNVGDLKKVLTNVKTRGTWGEVQLGAILEQMLSSEQYEANVSTKKGSNDRVEFAIKLPNKNDDEKNIWLPIDAKFPQEDYHRLLEAEEKADQDAIVQSVKQLESTIKFEAKKIQEKYLDPPNTTDFGIMFLPTEGLYAEVAKRQGLCETLQKDYRVVICGPTNLTALINSLQMGFKTLAIEKRSSEVWKLLGAVKTEFSRFGTVLEKTQKKIQEAHNTIEQAAVRTRVIERKLKDVEKVPSSESVDMLEDLE
ncbi:DNA recombination protein RmuC, partial [bacterium]